MQMSIYSLGEELHKHLANVSAHLNILRPAEQLEMLVQNPTEPSPSGGRKPG